MLDGKPMQLTREQAREHAAAVARVQLRDKHRQEALQARSRNFLEAMKQLYAERMVRTSNLATVRCPPEDVALARKIVAEQLTWEADMARRFGPFGTGRA